MTVRKDVRIALLIPLPIERFESQGGAYREAKRRERNNILRGINRVLIVTEEISYTDGEIKRESEEETYVLAYEYSSCCFSPGSDGFMKDIMTIEGFRSGQYAICIVKEVIDPPKEQNPKLNGDE